MIVIHRQSNDFVTILHYSLRSLTDSTNTILRFKNNHVLNIRDVKLMPKVSI